jgi:hypothetical protein
VRRQTRTGRSFVDYPILLKDGEVLTHSHRRDIKPLGHSRGRLRPLHLEQ